MSELQFGPIRLTLLTYWFTFLRLLSARCYFTLRLAALIYYVLCIPIFPSLPRYVTPYRTLCVLLILLLRLLLVRRS